MKITASHSLKLPVPGVEYGSMGASVAIEGEPPPDVQGDRKKLGTYILRLLAEAKARAEQHLTHEEPLREDDRQPRRNGQSRRPHRPMSGPNGRSNGSGHAGASRCSPKQANYMRSLATQAGLTYDDLGHMAEEAFGKRDIRALTKREASAMIDDLRDGEDR